jgi:uncharacterized protein YbjT (DUF2867 family)
MANRILVTGASGNIGRELVKQLQARGADFAVMTSKPGSTPSGVPSVQGDFTRPDTLPAAFARSSGAGADSASPASIARAQGEIDDIVAGSGIPFTLLRPTVFMQNTVNLYADTIKAAGAIYAPRGNGAVAVVDVRDIAEAAAAILTHPAAHAGAVYTLTGSEALTDAQIAATIGRAVGCDIKYVDVPEQTAVDAMTGMGYPPPVIDWLMSLNYVIKRGWAAGVSSDVQTLTGHPPRRFEDFAREHAVAWR